MNRFQYFLKRLLFHNQIFTKPFEQEVAWYNLSKYLMSKDVDIIHTTSYTYEVKYGDTKLVISEHYKEWGEFRYSFLKHRVSVFDEHNTLVDIDKFLYRSPSAILASVARVYKTRGRLNEKTKLANKLFGKI